MLLASDIVYKIEKDFDGSSVEAINLLCTELLTEDYLKSSTIVSGNIDRIIRCIVYLANKNIDKLTKYVNDAKADARDVMFWAEYENLADPHPKKVRDFSQPFS
jgi:hypothetical protein